MIQNELDYNWKLISTNSETSPLLCDKSEYPYPEETLPALIDRERTIRAEWQLSLKEQGKKLKENGKYSEHKPCNFIATEALPFIIEGVCAYINRIDAGKARKDKQNIEKLMKMPWIAFCAIAFTTMIDGAVRHERLSDVISRIADTCQTEVRWRNYEEREKNFYDILMKQQHQQNSSFQHMKDVLSVAFNRRAAGVYGDTANKELEWERWSLSFSRWLGALFVDITIGTTGLFQLDYINNTTRNTTSVFLNVTDKLETLINDTEWKIGLYGGYYLPLPVPPRDWTTTQCGGFWTKYAGQKRLIKNINRGYQEEMLERSEELAEHVFPAVNAAQHTAWRINNDIYEVLCALVDNKYTIAGLPAVEDPVLPVCPKCGQIVNKNHECFKEKDKNGKNPYLSMWKMQASNVYRERQSLKSKRLALCLGLEAANILLDDERFYYVYQTDFRGRLYPLGTLNPQGTDWQKAILEFADGVELGKTGVKWLAVHLANTWGNDKVSFDDRVQWVKDNEELILASANNPLDYLEWTKADEPFCFLAACMEWAKYKQYGESYKSHIAVALDGSCSGIQHYSAMLRDEVGALATNVKCIDASKGKNDIYGEVAKMTLSLIENDVADAENGDKAVYIMSHNIINRKTVKRAVMTLPYGSRYRSCSHYVGEEVIKNLKETGMNDAVELEKYANYVSKKVWQAIPMVVQAAREGMNYLQALARLFKDVDLPITWKAPTGFYVQQSYYDYSLQSIKLNIGGSFKLNKGIQFWANGTQNDRVEINFIDINDKVIDTTRQVSGIAPNFIHSLDASHLMFSVQNAKLAGINDFALIHDSLGVHAGKTEQFKKIINDCFYKLYAEHDPLGDLTKHLLAQAAETGKDAPLMPETGTLDLEDIKTAEYLFA